MQTSEQALGEIRIISFGFPPSGWALCNGQLLSIQENENLFELIGTTYGGNGVTHFALPDMRGRAPMHAQGTPLITLGGQIGSETVALGMPQIPTHTHQMVATNAIANTDAPELAVWATIPDPTHPLYAASGNVEMSSSCLTPTGGGQANGMAAPHENRQPFIAMNYMISLVGQVPTPAPAPSAPDEHHG